MYGDSLIAASAATMAMSSSAPPKMVTREIVFVLG
jgi:hypothetical protein